MFTKINVICSKADFSYIAYTEKYCQASKNNVTCYAFKPLAVESITESETKTDEQKELF